MLAHDSPQLIFCLFLCLFFTSRVKRLWFANFMSSFGEKTEACNCAKCLTTSEDFDSEYCATVTGVLLAVYKNLTVNVSYSTNISGTIFRE